MSGAPPRVVITGGPHAGKTTLLGALAAKGFTTVPEAALLVIDELNQRLGVAGQVRWRRENPAEFQARITETQLRLESDVPADGDAPVFFDRGILDGWSYCRGRGVPPPPALVTAEKRGRYSHVFVLATITPFSGRAETGRTSDEAVSRQIGELLLETYTEFGYDPVRVPQMSLEERLAFILERSVRGGGPAGR